MIPSTYPLFWRDSALPYVELRQVLDGRKVTYAAHSHAQWSIGAILEGQSEFICEDKLYQIDKGTLVLMNPDAVHACNPNQNSPWAYYMMHVDKSWLAQLLVKFNIRASNHWCNSQPDTLTTPVFYQQFVLVCRNLMSNKLSSLEKESLLSQYLITLFEYIDSTDIKENTCLPPNRLYKVANYLALYCQDDEPIKVISKKFGFNTSYLIRTFKRHFNMSPHAYRINLRIQLSQQALKQGDAISTVAQNAGFSDQAHFQRVFKQRVAATPAQYRRCI